MFIPFVNLVGLIIVGIAWIMAGSDTKQGIFKATGILMFINMIMSAIILAILFPFMRSLMSESLLGGYPSVPPGLFSEFLNTIGLFLLLAGVSAVLALVVWIFELVSHFRAATVYDVKWFKRAGWMRIITVIVGIIIIASFILLALTVDFYTPFFTTPSEIFNILGIYFIGIGCIALLGLLSLIFSAVSFFSIPEAKRERPPPYLPPPPE
ncbi:MAG: hypothetical protein QW810_01645 [Nitrososphaerota archaeon]